MSNFIDRGPFKGIRGTARANGTFLLEGVGLSIDLGNSETKAVVVIETDKGPEYPIYIFITLPNTFVCGSTIPLDDEVFKNENKEARSWRFYPRGAYITKNGEKVDLSQETTRHGIGEQAYWDAGTNATINASSGNEVALPAGSSIPKINTKTTVLTLNLVFGEVYRRISEKFDVPVEDFDIVFSKIGAMLPPKEFRDSETPDSGQKRLKEMILSVKNINFTHPKISKPIHLKNGIDSLDVRREGHPGFFYALFERMGKGVSRYREMYYRDDEKGGKSSILLTRLCVIIDIGSGTSDILLFRDGQITNSRGTVPVGAKKVALYVQDKLGLEKVSEEDVKNGYVTKGWNHKIDISAAINEGRKVVAGEIMEKFTEIIVNSPYSFDDVTSVLVIGGGAMPFHPSEAYEKTVLHPGEVKVDILPISEFFKKQFSRVAQYAEVLDLPLESYQDAGVRPTDPRMMNVCGMAFILHHRITTESA